MPAHVAPMIHVPDVRAAAAWYESIGFTIAETHQDGGVMDWADLRFGSGQVMLNAGAHARGPERRDVDLYVYLDDVDAVYESLKDRVDLVETLNDTFYGHRVFIIRDPNGFWITFAADTQAQR